MVRSVSPTTSSWRLEGEERYTDANRTRASFRTARTSPTSYLKGSMKKWQNCVQKTVEVMQLVPHERIQDRIAVQVVDIPLPQIMEEMVEVVLFIQRTRQNRTVEQIVDVSTLQTQEETSGLASCGMHATWHRFCVLRPPVPNFKGRLRSSLTGSMLPTTLWGKSPCEVSECVIRRLQNTISWTGSEAECRNAVCVGVLRICTVML